MQLNRMLEEAYLLTYFKMAKKQEFLKEIKIPEGVEVEVKSNEVIVKKGDKENKRRFSHVLIDKKEDKIIIKTERSTKREIKQVNTTVAHLKNMFRGVEERFVYKLQICSVHFPMNVSIQGNEVIIKNFLGEKKERKAKILHNSEVKIDKDLITVESSNKELAGQTAANIEKITKVSNKDRRIFQDGIFMIEKSGKQI